MGGESLISIYVREIMMLPEEGCLLRIFIGETDKHEGLPLFEWIVRKAREQGLAGATVLRGLLGFGAHSRISTAKILRLSENLPIVVEIIDTCEKIEAFLPIIDQSISEGMATLEKVRIRFYRSGK
jgi:PII-like signaling protein